MNGVGGWWAATAEPRTDERIPGERSQRIVYVVVVTGGVHDGSGDLDLSDIIWSQVEARQPVDEREQRSIERFKAEFAQLHAPFDEHAGPVHVTASAIVVGTRGVVLHRHRRLGIWLQPGGHIDPGETPWDAACREASEETGLHVWLIGPSASQPTPSLVHLDVHPGPRGHTHLDVRYLLEGADTDPAPGAGESQEVAWFDWDEAIALADPGLSGALAALRPSG